MLWTIAKCAKFLFKGNDGRLVDIDNLGYLINKDRVRSTRTYLT